MKTGCLLQNVHLFLVVKEGHPATLSILNYNEVARGTLRSLISKAGITVEKFLEALES